MVQAVLIDTAIEQAVGSGEDVAQDPRVIEHRSGVLATVTCRQADPVQVV
jgi:hypothetical protein